MPDSMVRNAYPELPVIPFQRTQVDMAAVIGHLNGMAAVPLNVRLAAYVIFANESGNGHSGVNNNYIGLQADGGRLADHWTPLFSGTCVHAETMTGRQRRFLCFNQWTANFDLLTDMISRRGLFVGGHSHPYANVNITTAAEWPSAYWREWVIGDRAAVIPDSERAGLMQIYAVAVQNIH